MAWWMRSLMVCLLALALPWQGVAAASRVFCGPGHHGAAAALALQAATHADTAAAHAHHHAMAAVGEDAGAQPASAQPQAQPDNHKCSACAACCAVGALLHGLPTVPALAPTATVFATVVALVDAFAVDGPDRPPRSLRA